MINFDEQIASYIQEGFDTLYHYTNIDSAIKILKNKYFKLTPAVTYKKDADLTRSVDKNHYYFLSLARNRFNEFVKELSNSIGVRLTLDADSLVKYKPNDFKLGPVSYFKHARETEERLTSTKQILPIEFGNNKLIKQIDVYFDNKNNDISDFVLDTYGVKLKLLLELCPDITIFFNKKDFINNKNGKKLTNEIIKDIQSSHDTEDLSTALKQSLDTKHKPMNFNIELGEALDQLIAWADSKYTKDIIMTDIMSTLYDAHSIHAPKDITHENILKFVKIFKHFKVDKIADMVKAVRKIYSASNGDIEEDAGAMGSGISVGNGSMGAASVGDARVHTNIYGKVVKRKLVNEEYYSNLYHLTKISNANIICKTNTIKLSRAYVDEWEHELTKNYFFLSMSRDTINAFSEIHDESYNLVYFVLDGNKLKSNFQIKPVHFFPGTPREEESEKEERIIYNKPTISNFMNYIKEIRVLGKSFNIKNVLPTIPVYFYNNMQDFIKGKNGKVMYNKVHNTHIDDKPLPKASMEVIEYIIKHFNTDNKNDIIKVGKYMEDNENFIKKYLTDPDVENIFIKFLIKNKFKTFEQFATYILNKVSGVK